MLGWPLDDCDRDVGSSSREVTITRLTARRMPSPGPSGRRARIDTVSCERSRHHAPYAEVTAGILGNGDDGAAAARKRTRDRRGRELSDRAGAQRGTEGHPETAFRSGDQRQGPRRRTPRRTGSASVATARRPATEGITARSTATSEPHQKVTALVRYHGGIGMSANFN